MEYLERCQHGVVYLCLIAVNESKGVASDSAKTVCISLKCHTVAVSKGTNDLPCSKHPSFENVLFFGLRCEPV